MSNQPAVQNVFFVLVSEKFLQCMASIKGAIGPLQLAE